MPPPVDPLDALAAQNVRQDSATKQKPSPAQAQQALEAARQMSSGLRRAYHGTTKDFARFDPSFTNDIGVHFGTAEQANRAVNPLGLREPPQGARVIPADLDLNNPLRVPDMFSIIRQRSINVAKTFSLGIPGFRMNEDERTEMYDAAQEADRVRRRGGGGYRVLLNEGLSKEHDAAQRRMWQVIQRSAERQGYDGLVYTNKVEGAGDSYVVFRPEQIRPAFAASGIDEGNPDVLFQRGSGTSKKRPVVLSDLFESPDPRFGKAAKPIQQAAFTPENLRKAFNLTADQAEAVHTLADAMGLDMNKLLLGVAQDSDAESFAQDRGKLGYDQAYLQRRFNESSLVPTRVAAEMMGESMPEYLKEVLKFMMRQRDRLREGKLRPSDVAKAYFLTLGSMHSGENNLSEIVKKTGYTDIPPEFITYNAKGEPMLRPEEAVAYWFTTEDGRRALDLVDNGVYQIDYTEQDFASLNKLRDIFGTNDIRNNALGLDSKNQYKAPKSGINLSGIRELTDRINAAGGDVGVISRALGDLVGIGAGKIGFIKHLLGMGDTATADAVELNYWLTGKDDVSKAQGRQAELARDIKEFGIKNKGTNSFLQQAVQKQLEALYDYFRMGEGPNGISKDFAIHLLHHWLWDKAKNAVTTHMGQMKSQENRTTDTLDQTFSENKRTLPKGLTHFLETGKALMRGFQTADVSTAAHELAHVARRALLDRSLPLEFRLGITDDQIRLAEDWCGVAEDGKWHRNAEETWAKAIEQGLMKGQYKNVPAPVKSIIGRFVDWISEIYKRFSKGPSHKNMSPEMVNLVENILSRKERLLAEGFTEEQIRNVQFANTRGQDPDSTPERVYQGEESLQNLDPRRQIIAAGESEYIPTNPKFESAANPLEFFENLRKTGGLKNVAEYGSALAQYKKLASAYNKELDGFRKKFAEYAQAPAYAEEDRKAKAEAARSVRELRDVVESMGQKVSDYVGFDVPAYVRRKNISTLYRPSAMAPRIDWWTMLEGLDKIPDTLQEALQLYEKAAPLSDKLPERTLAYKSREPDLRFSTDIIPGTRCTEASFKALGFEHVRPSALTETEKSIHNYLDAVPVDFTDYRTNKPEHVVNVYDSPRSKTGSVRRKSLDVHLTVGLKDFVESNPKGRFFLLSPGHAMALIDGVITDTAGYDLTNAIRIQQAWRIMGPMTPEQREALANLPIRDVPKSQINDHRLRALREYEDALAEGANKASYKKAYFSLEHSHPNIRLTPTSPQLTNSRMREYTSSVDGPSGVPQTWRSWVTHGYAHPVLKHIRHVPSGLTFSVAQDIASTKNFIGGIPVPFGHNMRAPDIQFFGALQDFEDAHGVALDPTIPAHREALQQMLDYFKAKSERPLEDISYEALPKYVRTAFENTLPEPSRYLIQPSGKYATEVADTLENAREVAAKISQEILDAGGSPEDATVSVFEGHRRAPNGDYLDNATWEPVETMDEFDTTRDPAHVHVPEKKAMPSNTPSNTPEDNTPRPRYNAALTNSNEAVPKKVTWTEKPPQAAGALRKLTTNVSFQDANIPFTIQQLLGTQGGGWRVIGTLPMNYGEVHPAVLGRTYRTLAEAKSSVTDFLKTYKPVRYLVQPNSDSAGVEPEYYFDYGKAKEAAREMALRMVDDAVDPVDAGVSVFEGNEWDTVNGGFRTPDGKNVGANEEFSPDTKHAHEYHPLSDYLKETMRIWRGQENPDYREGQPTLDARVRAAKERKGLTQGSGTTPTDTQVADAANGELAGDGTPQVPAETTVETDTALNEMAGEQTPQASGESEAKPIWKMSRDEYKTAYPVKDVAIPKPLRMENWTESFLNGLPEDASKKLARDLGVRYGGKNTDRTKALLEFRDTVADLQRILPAYLDTPSKTDLLALVKRVEPFTRSTTNTGRIQYTNRNDTFENLKRWADFAAQGMHRIVHNERFYQEKMNAAEQGFIKDARDLSEFPDLQRKYFPEILNPVDQKNNDMRFRWIQKLGDVLGEDLTKGSTPEMDEKLKSLAKDLFDFSVPDSEKAARLGISEGEVGGLRVTLGNWGYVRKTNRVNEDPVYEVTDGYVPPWDPENPPQPTPQPPTHSQIPSIEPAETTPAVPDAQVDDRAMGELAGDGTPQVPGETTAEDDRAMAELAGENPTEDVPVETAKTPISMAEAHRRYAREIASLKVPTKKVSDIEVPHSGKPGETFRISGERYQDWIIAKDVAAGGYRIYHIPTGLYVATKTKTFAKNVLTRFFHAQQNGLDINDISNPDTRQILYHIHRYAEGNAAGMDLPLDMERMIPHVFPGHKLQETSPEKPAAGGAASASSDTSSSPEERLASAEIEVPLDTPLFRKNVAAGSHGADLRTFRIVEEPNEANPSLPRYRLQSRSTKIEYASWTDEDTYGSYGDTPTEVLRESLDNGGWNVQSLHPSVEALADSNTADHFESYRNDIASLSDEELAELRDELREVPRYRSDRPYVKSFEEVLDSHLEHLQGKTLNAYRPSGAPDFLSHSNSFAESGEKAADRHWRNVLERMIADEHLRRSGYNNPNQTQLDFDNPLPEDERYFSPEAIAEREAQAAARAGDTAMAELAGDGTPQVPAETTVETDTALNEMANGDLRLGDGAPAGAVQEPAASALTEEPSSAPQQMVSAPETTNNLSNADLTELSNAGLSDPAAASETTTPAVTPDPDIQGYLTNGTNITTEEEGVAVQETPENINEAARRPPPAGTTFRTKRGNSLYTVMENGGTQRDKGASGWLHDGDTGLKPPSERTVYVTPQIAQYLGRASANHFRGPQYNATYEILPSGDVVMTTYRLEDSANPQGPLVKKQYIFEASATPEVGLHPVEVLPGGSRHIGSQITEVIFPEGSGQVPGETSTNAANLAETANAPLTGEQGESSMATPNVVAPIEQPNIDEGSVTTDSDKPTGIMPTQDQIDNDALRSIEDPNYSPVIPQESTMGSPAYEVINGPRLTDSSGLVRDIVIVKSPNLPGGAQVFYRSTGQSSKKPGTWFPFDGLKIEDSSGLWFDKERFTTGENFSRTAPLHRYGTDAYKEVSDWLGSQEGLSIENFEPDTSLSSVKYTPDGAIDLSDTPQGLRNAINVNEAYFAEVPDLSQRNAKLNIVADAMEQMRGNAPSLPATSNPEAVQAPEVAAMEAMAASPSPPRLGEAAPPQVLPSPRVLPENLPESRFPQPTPPLPRGRIDLPDPNESGLPPEVQASLNRITGRPPRRAGVGFGNTPFGGDGGLIPPVPPKPPNVPPNGKPPSVPKAKTSAGMGPWWIPGMMIGTSIVPEYEKGYSTGPNPYGRMLGTGAFTAAALKAGHTFDQLASPLAQRLIAENASKPLVNFGGVAGPQRVPLAPGIEPVTRAQRLGVFGNTFLQKGLNALGTASAAYEQLYGPGVTEQDANQGLVGGLVPTPAKAVNFLEKLGGVTNVALTGTELAGLAGMGLEAAGVAAPGLLAASATAAPFALAAGLGYAGSKGIVEPLTRRYYAGQYGDIAANAGAAPGDPAAAREWAKMRLQQANQALRENATKDAQGRIKFNPVSQQNYRKIINETGAALRSKQGLGMSADAVQNVFNNAYQSASTDAFNAYNQERGIKRDFDAAKQEASALYNIDPKVYGGVKKPNGAWRQPRVGVDNWGDPNSSTGGLLGGTPNTGRLGKEDIPQGEDDGLLHRYLGWTGLF